MGFTLDTETSLYPLCVSSYMHEHWLHTLQCTHKVCTLARKHYAHTRANACNLFYMHAYTQLPYSVKPRLCISRAFECWASLVALACKMESQWKYAAHATRLGAPTMGGLARGVPFVGVYVVWPHTPTSSQVDRHRQSYHT